MTNLTIPPEALEAAARGVHDIDRKIAGEDQWPAWEDISPTDQRRRLHRARAACLAMLNAWPGAVWRESGVGREIVSRRIVLPLPPEKETSE